MKSGHPANTGEQGQKKAGHATRPPAKALSPVPRAHLWQSPRSTRSSEASAVGLFWKGHSELRPCVFSEKHDIDSWSRSRTSVALSTTVGLVSPSAAGDGLSKRDELPTLGVESSVFLSCLALLPFRLETTGDDESIPFNISSSPSTGGLSRWKTDGGFQRVDVSRRQSIGDP